MKKVSLPTVLAYQKSMYTTLSRFYAYNSEDEHLYSNNFKGFKKQLKEVGSTVECTRTVRGDSGALKEKEKNIGASNIQTKEKAILPKGTDSLFLSFSLIVNKDWQDTHATNSNEFRDLYVNFTKTVVENQEILKKLVKLYVEQIYNAEWTWRNLKVCSSFQVFVYSEDKLLTKEQVEEEFYNALVSDQAVSFRVHCLMKMSEDSQVYPSQIFPVEEKGEKSGISGLLYKVDNQVAFSDVKIAAGLRMFDSWYEDNSKYKIVVNPFRVDQKSAYAYGKENDNHLYKYLNDLSEFNEELQSNEFKKFNENDYVFFLSCMILGGLYNDTKKEKEAK